MKPNFLIPSLAFALIATTSVTVLAQVPMGSLKGALTSEYKNLTYSFDEKSKSYVQTTLVTHITGQMKVSGALKILFKTDTVPVDETVQGVIGKKIAGYSRLKLQNANGGLLLVCEVQVADTLSGFPLSTSAKFAMPLRLVAGTWEDYLAGKTIDLELTPEGESIYNQEMTKGMALLFNNAFTNGFKEFEVGTSVDSVQLAQKVKMQANLKQISLSPLYTDYAIGLSLGI